LPPQARNNFGSNQFGGSSPSSQYGAPSFSSPRTNYGAPSQNSGRTNYAPPQSQYGAPSQQQQQPNSQYGAPAQQPNSQYGPPAQQSYDLPIEQDFGNNFQQSALSPQYGAPSSGSSRNGYSDSYSQGPANGGYEEPAKYEFQYDVQDEAAGLDFGHKEKRDGSVATGKYYVLLPDGRKQVRDDHFDLHFLTNFYKMLLIIVLYFCIVK
jgi:hypothetical protein